ncbi:uncharacterized protein LOC123967134, partial [Micropterus dolomieu]|uniref:uncharacterized protein LOC123967134 n=1 Tax=Micropterus dolomieu TaxID=147949 RepID=UPI001E8D2276
MNQCEETEEGVPPSKSTLWGEHGSQTEAQSPEKQQRPDSPGPSCVSMKSDQSIIEPYNFKGGRHSDEDRVHQQRPDSPGPSCVSMKSDQSIIEPYNFRDGQHSAEERVHQQRPDSPGPSCVSMKSDQSIIEPYNFKGGRHSDEDRVHQQRPDSPGPSCVSMKSDQSIIEPYNFRDGQHSAEERVQRVPGGQSVQQHPTDLDSIFMHLEENILTFMKSELKKAQKVLSTNYPECLERHSEDKEAVDGEEKEQRRISREAFLKITLHFLRRMKQDELADRLQSRTVALVCRRKLKSHLQKKCQSVFEGIAKAGNPTLLNQIYTELYITEGGTAEVNEEHEVRQIETASRRPDRPETTIRQEDIFK